MQIHSPLSNLSELLSQVKESASRYRATLERNEAATRAVLVDPVLRALGWDTANTYMVEVEKTLGQTRADYALYDSNTSVKVIIEAKSLGSNLAQANLIMSLVNYAFTFELQDIFLTDGLIWQHFTDFRPGNIRVERILNLGSDNPVECAAYLVQRLDAARFWPEEQTIDRLAQQVAQLENTVSSLQQELDRLGRPSAPSLRQPAPTAPRTQEDNESLDQVRFIRLEDLPDLTGKKPSHFKLPDESVLRVRSWKDVLVESCKFALTRNPHISVPLADRSGRRVSLFSTFRPPDGIAYVAREYNEQTVYIYVNYDARHCILNALYVLRYATGNDLACEPAVAIVDAR
ncbi:MAG: hypothetical protein U0641_20265 [Anaerolineae bacterium]